MHDLHRVQCRGTDFDEDLAVIEIRPNGRIVYVLQGFRRISLTYNTP
jgi:hypothetical protein